MGNGTRKKARASYATARQRHYVAQRRKKPAAAGYSWSKVVVPPSPRGMRSHTAGVLCIRRDPPRCVTCLAALNSHNADVQCWHCVDGHPLTSEDRVRLKSKIVACRRAIAARDGVKTKDLELDLELPK